ncbi:hypothetical protein Sango_2882200 [Sesamum angolense]|uniref:DDE Tnp4 domain-containing protein n=1 Tax=Sesamum angolense TaxID=2727404 RepID=A0AAE1T5M9_9LAMI|nr:hypothetical protein Sango_2882200 [Sesamum angolense]
MTKPCFYALVDALTSRGLLSHGQTSRVSPSEEVALFMQTVEMHKRQRDNMERFQISLETINSRFHRVLSALCAMAPELITFSSFTATHTRITNNLDFYPFFKTTRWYRHGSPCDQNRYRSRKGGLAQNVLAICDFDMNFTYVYAGWERSAADARVLDHAVSHDNTFPFPPIGPYPRTGYHLPEWRGQTRPYGTPQDMFNHAHSRLWNVIERCFGLLKKRFSILQWGMPNYLLNHQRFMWMIVDDNTRAPMRDDALAETQMCHWARGLRRHFGYPYTRDQPVLLVPRATLSQHARGVGPIRLPGVPAEDQGAAQDNESINSLRSPDAVEHVARGDGGPQMAHNTSLAARRSLDMGSEVGGNGSWTDYIRHFGVQSDRGAQTNNGGDSTARSRRPPGIPTSAA